MRNYSYVPLEVSKELSILDNELLDKTSDKFELLDFKSARKKFGKPQELQKYTLERQYWGMK